MDGIALSCCVLPCPAVRCAFLHATASVRNATPSAACTTQLTYRRRLVAAALAAADWDGGMAPGYFIAFKTIWCMGVGMNSVGVGFMSATSDKTFTIIRQRFAERPTTASWSQSRNGRSLAETQYGAVTIGSPNIGAGDL
jgi:hypothetical protein